MAIPGVLGHHYTPEAGDGVLRKRGKRARDAAGGKGRGRGHVALL